MRVKVLAKLAAAVAACAVVVAGSPAAAAQADSPRSSAPAGAGIAAIVTVFDLNGSYVGGGPARAVISNVNGFLTVNMSAFGRPNASGSVLARDLIRVTFPDDATHGAVLVAPGTIRWANGTQWRKLQPVPNVLHQEETTALQILSAAGLAATVSRPTVSNCNVVDRVSAQNPAAGTLVLPGSLVRLTIPQAPSGVC